MPKAFKVPAKRTSDYQNLDPAHLRKYIAWNEQLQREWAGVDLESCQRVTRELGQLRILLERTNASK